MNKKIITYFQTTTPESAEIGDFADQGEHDETSFDNTESIDDVVRYLKNRGPLVASSSNFHSGLWYSTVDPDQDIYSGEETFYSFHLENFSELEQRMIFNSLIKKAV